MGVRRTEVHRKALRLTRSCRMLNKVASNQVAPDLLPASTSHQISGQPMDSIPALFRHNESISFTRCHPDGIFFLQQRPEENNAQVLMRLTANGELQRM